MIKRIEDVHEEAITGTEDVKQYVEHVKKFKIIYKGFLKTIKSLDIKGKYLEIGAGPGILTAIVAEDNPEVNITAVDISSDMVTLAQEYCNEKKLQDRIHFIIGDASNEATIKNLGKFDLVYCTFTMHHWKNPEKVISNLLKAVTERGTLFIYDLRRVWWLYYLPLRKSGFINSIRAAYVPGEIRILFQKLGIAQYEIKKVFPIMQSIIVKC